MLSLKVVFQHVGTPDLENFMSLEGTLKNRDGALYILYTATEDNEPIRQYVWYRVIETRGTGYGERPEIGDLVTRISGGDWRARNPVTHRATGHVSTGTGSQQRVERNCVGTRCAGRSILQGAGLRLARADQNLLRRPLHIHPRNNLMWRLLRSCAGPDPRVVSDW